MGTPNNQKASYSMSIPASIAVSTMPTHPSSNNTQDSLHQYLGMSIPPLGSSSSTMRPNSTTSNTASSATTETQRPRFTSPQVVNGVSPPYPQASSSSSPSSAHRDDPNSRTAQGRFDLGPNSTPPSSLGDASAMMATFSANVPAGFLPRSVKKTGDVHRLLGKVATPPDVQHLLNSIPDAPANKKQESSQDGATSSADSKSNFKLKRPFPVDEHYKSYGPCFSRKGQFEHRVDIGKMVILGGTPPSKATPELFESINLAEVDTSDISPLFFKIAEIMGGCKGYRTESSWERYPRCDTILVPKQPIDPATGKHIQVGNIPMSKLRVLDENDPNDAKQLQWKRQVALADAQLYEKWKRSTPSKTPASPIGGWSIPPLATATASTSTSFNHTTTAPVMQTAHQHPTPHQQASSSQGTGMPLGPSSAFQQTSPSQTQTYNQSSPVVTPSHHASSAPDASRGKDLSSSNLNDASRGQPSQIDQKATIQSTQTTRTSNDDRDDYDEEEEEEEEEEDEEEEEEEEEDEDDEEDADDSEEVETTTSSRSQNRSKSSQTSSQRNNERASASSNSDVYPKQLARRSQSRPSSSSQDWDMQLFGTDISRSIALIDEERKRRHSELVREANKYARDQPAAFAEAMGYCHYGPGKIEISKMSSEDLEQLIEEAKEVIEFEPTWKWVYNSLATWLPCGITFANDLLMNGRIKLDDKPAVVYDKSDAADTDDSGNAAGSYVAKMRALISPRKREIRAKWKASPDASAKTWVTGLLVSDVLMTSLNTHLSHQFSFSLEDDYDSAGMHLAGGIAGGAHSQEAHVFSKSGAVKSTKKYKDPPAKKKPKTTTSAPVASAKEPEAAPSKERSVQNNEDVRHAPTTPKDGHDPSKGSQPTSSPSSTSTQAPRAESDIRHTRLSATSSAALDNL